MSLITYDDYLAHFGVKGMRWGVRKASESKNANPNYTVKQRRRDAQVYGMRGQRRINKAMNKGDSLSIARGDEKTRRDRVLNSNKYVRQGGKVAGTVAGVVAANVGMTAVAKATFSGPAAKLVNATLGQNGATALRVAMQTPAVRFAVSAGAAKVGNMMAGDLAVNTRMRAHGYNPNRR